MSTEPIIIPTPVIVSAAYDPWGNILVVFEGQKPDTAITIPQYPGNKDYDALMKWVEGGGVIDPYVPPPAADPAPTMEDLMARIAALEASSATTAGKTSKK